MIELILCLLILTTTPHPPPIPSYTPKCHHHIYIIFLHVRSRALAQAAVHLRGHPRALFHAHVHGLQLAAEHDLLDLLADGLRHFRPDLRLLDLRLLRHLHLLLCLRHRARILPQTHVLLFTRLHSLQYDRIVRYGM